MNNIIIIVFFLITIINSTPLTCLEALTIIQCKDIINGIHECIWYENKCQLKSCQNTQIPCDGQVYNGELCSTNKQGCQSIKNCSDIDNQQSCSLIKPYGIECYWEDSCIIKDCSHNSKQNCKLTNGQKCIYQDEKCQSINQCIDIIDKSSCLTSKILGINCFWMNDQCITDSCKAIKTMEHCFKSIRNSEKCFFSQNKNEDNYCLSCSELNEQCKCEYYNLFGCQWQNNTCLEIQQQFQCNIYLNEIQCMGDMQCIWYKPMNKCLTIEEASQNDRACDIYIFSTILNIWILIIVIIFQ